MFLSNFSVKKPIVTIVILIMLMAMGLLALKKLKVNQIPDVDLPLLVIDINYPGASPDTVEREVLNRVEKAMQSVNGIKDLRGTASEGNANIQVFFEFKKNMVEATDEVRNAIGKVRYASRVLFVELGAISGGCVGVRYLWLPRTSIGHARVSGLASQSHAPSVARSVRNPCIARGAGFSVCRPQHRAAI